MTKFHSIWQNRRFHRKCVKTHAIPTLMHQMRNSTKYMYVCSAMFRPCLSYLYAPVRILWILYVSFVSDDRYLNIVSYMYTRPVIRMEHYSILFELLKIKYASATYHRKTLVHSCMYVSDLYGFWKRKHFHTQVAECVWGKLWPGWNCSCLPHQWYRDSSFCQKTQIIYRPRKATWE
jgi:hypothetical protein